MPKFTVRQGQRYHATVTLSLLEQIATNELIAGQLTAAGFADVVVTGKGKKRSAEARWPGPGRTAELDPHLTEVVEVA